MVERAAMNRAALAVLVVVGVFPLGCSSSKSAERAPPSAENRAPAFYPLKVGNRWTYDELAMGRVHNTWQTSISQQASPTRYVQDIQLLVEGKPSKPARQVLEVRPRGIFDGTRYVLEEPVTVGKKWMTVLDVSTAEKFEIVSVDSTVEVPAGRFSGCVRVRNTITDPGKVVQLTEPTFCRDVGMVETRISIQKPGKPDIVVSHMRLLRFESDGKQIFPPVLGGG